VAALPEAAPEPVAAALGAGGVAQPVVVAAVVAVVAVVVVPAEWRQE
jgi:hypothetical protein